MMSKKMIVGVILTALVAALIMVGCNKKTGGTSAGKTKVTVLSYADMTVANTATDQKWTWDTFRENHPDVDLVVEELFNEPFHQKTEAYAASGNLPSVLYVWPSGRSTSLHVKRLLKDLGPFIDKDGLRGIYVPTVLDPTQQASGYIAMIAQATTSSHAFYVNTEVLNDCGLQPAKTYAELKAQVPVLRAKGYETVIMPNRDTWVMQSCLFSAIAGRFCGAGWEQAVLDGRAKFTDADFVKALEFIKSLFTDRVLAPSSLGLDYGDGPGLFATNKGAYMIDGDWRVGDFVTDATTGQALIAPARQNNFKITVFPDIEGAKINKSTSGILGTGWAMSAALPSGSKEEAAAWELIKWLTGKEVLTRGVEHGAFANTSRSDIDVNALDLEPLQRTAVNMGKEYTTTTVVIDGVFHSDVFNPLNDGLQEIGLGSKTPQQVAADTQKAFDAAKAAGKF